MSKQMEIAFLIMNDQEVLILRHFFKDQSPGSIRDTLECKGYELAVVDGIDLVNDGNFFKVTVYDAGTMREIISNGSLYCETIPTPF